jgi:hypothetical protein
MSALLCDTYCSLHTHQLLFISFLIMLPSVEWNVSILFVFFILPLRFMFIFMLLLFLLYSVFSFVGYRHKNYSLSRFLHFNYFCIFIFMLSLFVLYSEFSIVCYGHKSYFLSCFLHALNYLRPQNQFLESILKLNMLP